MTTSGGKPAARASKPGRAVKTGRDGPWRAAGRPRPQLLAAEETGGSTGPPTDAVAARLLARSCRRGRPVARQGPSRPVSTARPGFEALAAGLPPLMVIPGSVRWRA